MERKGKIPMVVIELEEETIHMLVRAEAELPYRTFVNTVSVECQLM
jgi:hypothetical protein